MKFAVLTLILSVSSWGIAHARDCEGLLLSPAPSSGPEYIQRDIHHQLVLDLSLPPRDRPSEKTFLTHLHMRNPNKLKLNSDKEFELVPNRAPYRTLHYSPETEEDMWRSVVRHTIGRAPYDEAFYEAVELSYGGRVPEEVKKAVQQLEKEIPKDRTWLALVYSEIQPGVQGSLEGTMRISDGSSRGVTNTLTSSPLLPFERIFEILKVKSRLAQELRQLRLDNPNAAIYELGQLTLDPKLSSDERRRALLLIELAFLDVVASRSPEAIYFTHVADEGRRILYQRTWGWTVAETLDVQYGEGESAHRTKDHVLTITGAKLKLSILKRLGLSESALKKSPYHD